MKTAYLSLGSNVGDRLFYLKQAIENLNRNPAVQVEKISSIYETAAWGLESQNDFYNLVLEISTSLLPEGLLQACQKIELELERTREIHWGPRTIDIDILLYESIEMDEAHLTIPHQYLLERPFVTIPLAEIAPDIRVKNVNISLVAKEHRKLEEKCLQLEYVTENLLLSRIKHMS